MKLAVRIATVLCVAGVVNLAPLCAQPGLGPGRTGRYYNTATETKTSGTIAEVREYKRGSVSSIHLVLKSEAETIDVHLGPSAYIANQGFAFAKGDTIQVLGSRVKIGTDSALIAREVTKDRKKLTLRDATGRPLWARAGRRVTG